MEYIASIIGYEATVKLMTNAGGSSYYIPKVNTDHNMIKYYYYGQCSQNARLTAQILKVSYKHVYNVITNHELSKEFKEKFKTNKNENTQN